MPTLFPWGNRKRIPCFHRHAQAALWFLLEHFVEQRGTCTLPDAGVELVVYTRMDGAVPLDSSVICCGSGSPGHMLRFALFNSLGEAFRGLHYDALFRDRRDAQVHDLTGDAESSRPGTGGSLAADVDAESLERLWGLGIPGATCLARSWQKLGFPILVQCPHPRSSGEFCRYHTTEKKRALGIWDPPAHSSLPRQKRLDALAEIPKRLRKIAGSAVDKGGASGARAACVEPARVVDADDVRMLIAMGVSGEVGEGGGSLEMSAPKRLRVVQDD